MKILIFFLSLSSLLVYAQGGIHPGELSAVFEGLQAIRESQKISCDEVPSKNTIALKDLMKREQVSFPFTSKCHAGWWSDLKKREELAEMLRKSLYEYGLKQEEDFIEAGLRKKDAGDETLTLFEDVYPVLNEVNMNEASSIFFPEKDAWLNKISNTKNSQDRCELLKLAMSHAIWTIDTIQPLRKINSMKAMFYDPNTALNEERNLYRKDLHRALASFRFLAVVPPDQFPSNCYMNEYGKDLPVREVFLKRYNFAANVPKAFGDSVKYPIGMSVAMCGRPMNSHYLDTTEFSPELGDNMGQPWTVVEPDCK